jgi:hypothetical protein
MAFAILCTVFSIDTGHAAEESAETPFWGEIYAASVATDAEDGNVTSDPFLRWGVRVFELAGRPVDLYAKARFYHDAEANYWNNKWQLGAGTRWFPLKDHGLALFFEYLYTEYTGRERAGEPAPDPSGEFGVESGAAYWGWFGPEPWSISGVELYAPFSGWREIYADAIYYERDGDNVIGTLDHKEGVFLAKIGDATLDAYLTVEAGLDVNEDPWNHYVKGGPGFRITPFSHLDLKVSFEYFLGRYTRGGYGDVDRNIADFEVTASFWMGW